MSQLKSILLIDTASGSAEEQAYVYREQSDLAQTWVGRILLLAAIIWSSFSLLDLLVPQQVYWEIVPIRIATISMLLALSYINFLRKNLNYQFKVGLAATSLSSVAVTVLSLLYDEHYHMHYFSFVLIMIAGLGFFPFGLRSILLILGVLLPYIVITALFGHIINTYVFILGNAYILTSTVMLFVMQMNYQQHILGEIRMKYKQEGRIGLLHTIVEDADEGVVILNGKGMIIEANNIFLNRHLDVKLGGEPTRIEELYSSEDQKIIKSNLATLENDSSVVFEIEEGTGKDRVSIEVAAKKMMINGEDLTVAFYRDITTRKKLYQQLAYTQKMETLSQMAFGISHDFKNVLATMQAYVEFIQHANANDIQLLYPVLKNHTETIHKEIQQANSLISNLISLGGDAAAKFEDVAINSIIKDSVEANRKKTPEISITVNLAESIPVIKGSPVHLTRVFTNLLNNASDAMSNKGDIHVSSKFAHRPGDMPGDYIEVTVSDTGPGIAEEHLPHIFEPFYSTKKRRSVNSGTGLGLAIVDNIVKSHGGKIKASNNKGQGAVFEIYLPVEAMFMGRQNEISQEAL